MSSDDQEAEAREMANLRLLPTYVRELKFKNRQLRKSCGKQGETIHRLRAELAEVRLLNSKIERGDLRRLERVAQEQAESISAQKQIISMLEEKLSEEPVAVDADRADLA